MKTTNIILLQISLSFGMYVCPGHTLECNSHAHISIAQYPIHDDGEQREDDQYEAANFEDQQQRCKHLATVNVQVDLSVGYRSNYTLC